MADETEVVNEPSTDTTPADTTKAGEGGAPPAEAVAQEKVVPESYDLKSSENSLLSDERLKELTDSYKERGFSNEEAQADLKLSEGLLDKQRADQEAEYEAMKKSWLEEAKNDKDFGGENFKENAEAVKRLQEGYFDKSLTESMDALGWSNRPDVFRSLARIAKELGVMDDKRVNAGNQIQPHKKSVAEIMYPSHYKQTETN